MAKIGLNALAWEMPQGNERLAMATSVLMHIALHLAVTSVVTVFVLQATKDLHGGVALLDGRVFVVGQDLVDDRLNGPQDWSRSIPGPGTGARLGMLQDMPDCPAREFEFTGDPSDGVSLPIGPSNGTVIVHRKHFLGLRAG
jgi:hypothetical protein